ncbi:hypothetical protein [uncultured Planktosalinus sp.]|uniref:hypothetical protein n=1 Tax=uncultured Planktosalinus sp. TaxID=1810935 RepID=UPI0030DC18E1
MQGAAIGTASSRVASFTAGGGAVAQSAMGAFTGGAIAKITGGQFCRRLRLHTYLSRVC